MYFPGHLGIALLCFTPIAAYLQHRGLQRATRVGLVGFLLTASAPDVDLYLATVPHRGITHTLAAAVAVGLLFGVVGVLTRSPAFERRRHDFLFAFAVGTLGICTHLLGDVVTPMGIRPFAPLFDGHYTVNLVSANDPGANAGLLVAGLTTYRATAGAVELLRRPVTRDAPQAFGDVETDLR